jgi:hypothetical protein
MRAIIVLSAAIAAALAVSPSFAQEWLSVWRVVDPDDQHTYEVFIDESSIRAESTTRTATVKYLRTAPHSRGKSGERVAYSITSKSFQCDARRIRLDTSEIHFPDGSLQYVDARGKAAWHAAHDPAAVKALDIVCAAKNPKPG